MYEYSKLVFPDKIYKHLVIAIFLVFSQVRAEKQLKVCSLPCRQHPRRTTSA